MVDKKSEALKQLAETLIKSGLATSESLAIEKAREMLDLQERTKIRPSMETERGVDVESEERTVDELMKEAGVGTEKEENSGEEEKAYEKPEEGTEEVAQEESEEDEKEEEAEEANEEEGEEDIIIREQTEELEEEEESEKKLKKPTYDKKKKVDLSNVFNYGKR